MYFIVSGLVRVTSPGGSRRMRGPGEAIGVREAVSVSGSREPHRKEHMRDRLQGIIVYGWALLTGGPQLDGQIFAQLARRTDIRTAQIYALRASARRRATAPGRRAVSGCASWGWAEWRLSGQPSHRAGWRRAVRPSHGRPFLASVCLST
jgi:hypothetical protein